MKEASGTEPVPTGEVGVADGNIVDAEFSNEERHLRRLNKVKALDR